MTIDFITPKPLEAGLVCAHWAMTSCVTLKTGLVCLRLQPFLSVRVGQVMTLRRRLGEPSASSGETAMRITALVTTTHPALCAYYRLQEQADVGHQCWPPVTPALAADCLVWSPGSGPGCCPWVVNLVETLKYSQSTVRLLVGHKVAKQPSPSYSWCICLLTIIYAPIL